MALNGSPIWGRVKTTPPPFSHLGISGYGSGRSGFALNLRLGYRKWECCSLAQRAITLVDDEKPFVPVADTSGPVEKALSSESMRFHKDLNLLPNMHKSYLHGLHGVEVCMAHIKRLQNCLHFFGTVVEESESRDIKNNKDQMGLPSRILTRVAQGIRGNDDLMVQSSESTSMLPVA